MKTECTHQQTLSYQASDLRLWKSILKPEVYDKVEKLVLSENEPLPEDPFDICRGWKIEEIVMQQMIGD